MELVADRYAESRAHLEAALGEEGLGDAILCGIHADLFWAALALGDRDAAFAHADDGLALARTVSELPPRARAYAAAAHARFVREGGIADDLIAEEPDLWGPLDGLPMKDWPRVTLAAEAVESGDLERGSALVLELLSTAEARGDDLIREELLDRHAEVCLQSGEWLEGRDVSRSCRDLELQLYGTASESARLAWFEGALGDAERARADVDQALESDRAVAWTKRWARAALGMVELSLGRPEAALEHLEALGADRPPPGVGDPGIAWCFLPDLVEALVGVGRAADADDHVHWLEERGHALNRPWAIATGARCRGLILAADGVLDVAIERLEFALEAHERLPMPYERGRTLLVLGTVRRRAGRKRLAREALDEAGSLFGALGAVGWRQRVDAELGHITGRRPSAGRLTDAEQRVARLAAAGFRNREIAAQLFMSVRTVEGHLSDVYGKLSIRSRTELAVFFGDPDDPASPGSGTSVVDR
jgi:DNA-binding CsgD family transcriptional regulator